MADNTVLSTNVGTGDTIATDDIGGVKYPRTKLVIGADGTNDGDVSSANPLPVDLGANNDVTLATLPDTSAGDLAAIRASLGGTLTVGSHAVTNAGTFAVQVDGTALTRLTDIETNTNYGAVTGGGVEASALRVTIASDSTGVISIDDAGGSITVDGTVAISGTVTVGSHAVTNAGTFAVQAAQSGTWNVTNISGTVSLPTGASTLAEQQSQTALLGTIDADTSTLAAVTTGVGLQTVPFVDTGAGFVSLNVDGSGRTVVVGTGTFAVQSTLQTGSATIGKLAANSGVDIGDVDVTSLPSVTIGTWSAGTLTVSGTVTANLSTTDNDVLDAIELNTSKGTSHYRNIDANAEAEIKGSAGTLHWIQAINLTAAIAYLHLYDNTAASVTPGTTTPTYTFPIPTAGSTNGAGFVLRLEQAFATGITLVVTTTVDGSAGDPGTNGVMINAGYT